MTSIRRVAGSAVVLTALLGLTACNDEDPVAPSAKASTPSASSTSSTDSSAPSTSPSTSAPAPAKPAAKGSVKDKTAIAAEQAALPAGPVTSIDVKLLGGYSSNDSGYGEFYAVLDVTSNKPGLTYLKYEMLDSSGKVLGNVETSIAVGGQGRELKITRAPGKLPPASAGTVSKVRLVVTKNSPNEFATVTQVEQSSLRIGQDPETNSPTVSGRYRTVGKANVISMNAVCVDAAGVVQSADSPVSKITAPQWTPFTVNLLYAKAGFTPKTCYVGS